MRKHRYLSRGHGGGFAVRYGLLEMRDHEMDAFESHFGASISVYPRLLDHKSVDSKLFRDEKRWLDGSTPWLSKIRPQIASNM